MRVWWNGQWHQLGPVDKPEVWQARYGRLLALWKDDPTAAGRSASDYLISRLGADFLASADSPPGGSQRQRYAQAIELLLDWDPERSVAEFGPADFRAWLRWLAQLRSGERQRFNRTSIRHFAGCVRRVWRWGVENRGVLAESWQALRAVAPPRINEAREPEPVRPADPAAVAAVLPFLPPAVRGAVQLLRLTAARPSEILLLRPCDLDRSGVVWWYRPHRHKNSHRGKPREIAIGQEAQAVLSPWLEGCEPTGYVFAPGRGEERRSAERDAKRKPARYPSEERRRLRKKAAARPRTTNPYYTHHAFGRAIRRACERAGVHFTAYMLRHLRGSEVRAAFGLEAARAVLGQTSLSMAEHYTTSADRELAERVARGEKAG